MVVSGIETISGHGIPESEVACWSAHFAIVRHHVKPHVVLWRSNFWATPTLVQLAPVVTHLSISCVGGRMTSKVAAGKGVAPNCTHLLLSQHLAVGSRAV
jgi:hypothetical protein